MKMRAPAWLAAIASALGALTMLSACGSSGDDAPTRVSKTPASGADSQATKSALPGTGKPTVTIGDENFTEQFILGELYGQALEAEGYSVVLNRNIGPTEVRIQALESGALGMYPEYLETFDQSVAGLQQPFRTRVRAYRAGARYAVQHGLRLLAPTPFSNTDAIGVTRAYAQEHRLRSLGDLRTVGATMTLGGPVQFQQDPVGLPAIEQAYGFVPAAFKPLGVGTQYQALDQNVVQAADVSTTDGELVRGKYSLLRDPLHTFGWGNVVPVISAKVLALEGPVFASTIERVSRLLTTPVMRRLNAAVDVGNQDPAAVAKQFLLAHGISAQTA
jgi:glycine betaine/choline ABC-type transport system substrate-binding protein